jgi:hypothetical protein
MAGCDFDEVALKQASEFLQFLPDNHNSAIAPYSLSAVALTKQRISPSRRLTRYTLSKLDVFLQLLG